MYILANQDKGLNLLNFIKAINAPKIEPKMTPIDEMRIVSLIPLIKNFHI